MLAPTSTDHCTGQTAVQAPAAHSGECCATVDVKVKPAAQPQHTHITDPPPQHMPDPPPQHIPDAALQHEPFPAQLPGTNEPFPAQAQPTALIHSTPNQGAESLPEVEQVVRQALEG